jgi:cytochrome c-type biogenesis protein CcmH
VVAIPPKGAAAHVLISIFLLMAAVAVLPLLWLLLRERGAGKQEADDPARVYAAQFHEVARDRARGAIDAEAASTLEAEIGRRLLAASRGAAGTGGRRLALGERVIVGLGILIVLPAGAFAWYEGMGGDRRALADAAPPGIRQGPSAPDRQGRDAPHDMAESATRLAERLEAEPDNLEGWLLLARSYTQLGRSAEAARAYRRIAGIASAPPARLASIAEDLIAISAGTVSPEALDLLRAANRRDPAEPRARFFLGLARAQAGAAEEGLDLWLALERDSPADAPWLDGLRANIGRLAEEIGIAPAALAQRRARLALAATGRAPIALPAQPQPPAPTAPPQPTPQPTPPPSTSAPRGPSAQDVAAASRLSAEDRAGMIRGMVEGLAARLEGDPSDIDGWLRLGRAYRVLGENEKGLAALRQAADRAPDRGDVLRAYSAAIATAPADVAARHPAASVHDRLLALAPAQPEALQTLGDGALEAGDKLLARRYWERLYTVLPAGTPARRAVEERLERLGPR